MLIWEKKTKFRPIHPLLWKICVWYCEVPPERWTNLIWQIISDTLNHAALQKLYGTFISGINNKNYVFCGIKKGHGQMGYWCNSNQELISKLTIENADTDKCLENEAPADAQNTKEMFFLFFWTKKLNSSKSGQQSEFKTIWIKNF